MSNPASYAAQRLEGFLRDTLGQTDWVPLHTPCLEGKEREYLVECVDSGWVSSAGPFVDRLEKVIADLCGVRYAVATVNGTSALHAALVTHGVGPGDAVIVPALTFIATANAVSYTGALPLFFDIDADTLALSTSALVRFMESDCESRDGALVHKATGLRIAAAIPVHIFGHPADIEHMVATCAKYHIPVIEDATEALGSTFKGRPCGSLGTVGALSFNGNKIVTSGGGGMILSEDPETAATLKHLTTTARQAGALDFDHDRIGFNYRMPNVNAALALAQLENLESFVARKRALAQRYAEVFADLDGLRLLHEPADSVSNYWLQTLVFDDPDEATRFIAACEEKDIMTRPAWRLLPDTGAYRDTAPPSDLSVARDLSPRLVNIPSSAWLLSSDDD